MRKQYQDGLTLVEAIMSIAVLAVTFGVLVTTLSTGYRGITSNRNQLLAEILASSTLDEIYNHRYGNPLPKTWGTSAAPSQQEVRVIHDGNPAVLVLTRYIESATDKGGNGSFFDSEKTDSGDLLRVRIGWTESGAQGSLEKENEFYVTVWRHDVTTRGF